MTHFTTRGGLQIAYETFGDPLHPPVLFIRGTGAAGNRWQPQVEDFAADFYCVTFDNRGVGASSVPPAPYTIDAMAADALDLLDHLDIQAAHLIGSSLGGAIALRLCAQHPDRALSLQLHSSWLVTEGYASYSLRLLRTLLERGGVDLYYEATIPLLFSPAFLAERFSDLQAILEGMLAHASSPDGLRGQIEANLGHDGRQDAAGIGLPTLVTVGSQDLIFPPAVSRQLHEAIPGSAFHVFDGGGHLVSMEAAPEFNRVTLGWLRGLSDR